MKLYIKQRMGNNLCCGVEYRSQKSVTSMSNNIPSTNRYKMVRNETVRFLDVSVRKSQRNRYIFTMGIRDQVEIHVEIPVINEIVHCVTTQNYELKLESRMIIDIFNKRYQDTLIDVCNEKTGQQFSMKIVPFKSYTSLQFKQSLYQLWLNRKVAKNSNFIRLLDYFIYGMNEEQQGFVFLFERCQTSLANVAQYRKYAEFGWMENQKIQIIEQIFDSYQVLVEKNIVHRDIRPSNVFYSPASKRFMLGNLSVARLLRPNEDEENDDLLTVCGIPNFSCSEVENLITNSQSIGYYRALKQDYIGLKSILNILETCQILDKNPEFISEQIQILRTMLANERPFDSIVKYIRRIISALSIDRHTETEDKQFAKSCSYLLAHTHKLLIEQYIFKSYGYLGYHKQFTGKAYRMMEINVQNQKELENAPILKKLGEFYENKGSKGTQYFYNSFALYIKRAEAQLKFGYPEKSDYELDKAKQAYLKLNQNLQSDLPRIEINRVASLIQLENKNSKLAEEIISETLVKAAKEKIPTQKQCKILLAYGRILRKDKDINKKEEAVKKLLKGLNMCENGTIFQSPSSCRIYKSHFNFQMGSLYLDEVLAKHDPKKSRFQQPYGLEIRGKAEIHLRSSLQIRQRQAVDDMDVAECLISLGMLHYIDENFYDAKRYFERSLIRMNHMRDQINPLKFVNSSYMKGSASYYLSEFSQASKQYQNAIKILEEKRPDQFLLKYNIEGNLGLTWMQMGLEEGREKIEEALESIKTVEGEKSYDYACLKANLLKMKKI